jgi:alkyl hydroperoxide reductase subunit AhpC
MPSYEEDLSEFERRDAQVLGISVDQVHCNEAWAKSMGGLSYPLLSDNWPYGYVSTLYGIMRGDGLAERAIFVVDKSGKIATSTFTTSGAAAHRRDHGRARPIG